VLPEIMGPPAQARADYLDHCRSKRNVSDYDRTGEISAREAEELHAGACAFREEVLAWLMRNHPTLVPKKAK